jgi:crossover junction endodeoxyribonuclease RuvC
VVRILGIDPGSQVTGFGVIDADGSSLTRAASGCIALRGAPLAERLRAIFEGISEVIVRLEPQEVAIEQVFVHRNVDSALKLGQARGAALCAVAMRSVPVFEYTPREVKQAVVGKGGAAKEQVQYMVRVLLNLAQPLEADAADALAVALCHGHQQRMLLQAVRRSHAVRGWRRGRWR